MARRSCSRSRSRDAAISDDDDDDPLRQLLDYDAERARILRDVDLATRESESLVATVSSI